MSPCAECASNNLPLWSRLCPGPGYARPAFWVAVLWKRLMGRDVVAANVTSGARNRTAGVRAYCHRTPHGYAGSLGGKHGGGRHGRATEGGAENNTVGRTVLLINVSPMARQVAIQCSPGTSCGQQDEYHVEPGPSDTVNGAHVPPRHARTDESKRPKIATPTVTINGVVPRFASSTSTALPKIMPVTSWCGKLVAVPAHTLVFVVIRPSVL